MIQQIEEIKKQFYAYIESFQNSQSNQNLQDLIILIQNAQGNSNKNVMIQATQNLQYQQKQNFINHLAMVFQIMNIINSTEKLILKHISTYLYTFSKQFCNNPQITDYNILIQLISANLCIIYKDTFDQQEKQFLCISIAQLLKNIDKFNNKSNLYKYYYKDEIMKAFISFIQEQISTEQQNLIGISFQIIDILVLEMFQNSDIQENIDYFLVIFYNIGEQINKQFQIQNYINVNLLKNISDNLLNYIKKLYDLDNNDKLSEQLECLNLHSFLEFTLKINIYQQNLNLVVLNLNKNNIIFDNQINQIKYQSLKCSQYLNNFYNKKIQIEQQNNFFTNSGKVFKQFELYSQNLFLYLIQQNQLITYLFNDQNFLNGLYKQYAIQQNILISLNIINQSFQNRNFYNFFNQNFQIIILEIAIPYIILKQDDLLLFIENCHEFCQKQTDITDVRLSDIPVSTSAEIIFQLCKNIDGIMPWIFQFTLEYIQYLIMDIQIPNLCQQIINKISDQNIILKIDKSLLIDSFLQILCIIQPLLVKRKDLLYFLFNQKNRKLLINFLQNKGIIQYLFKFDNNLIQFRCCLFIKKYISNFADEQNLFGQCLKYLLIQINLSQQPCIRIQSIESLFSIAGDKINNDVIKNSFSDILSTVITLISNCEIPEFFEFFDFLIKEFSPLLERYIETLMEKMVIRFKQEFNKCKQNNQKENIIITRILQVIQRITTQSCIMDDSFVTFENKILEILKYLEICEDINFEDDLIMIFCSVIQHIDDFKDYHDIFCKSINKLYIKNDKQIHNLFDIFYHVCKYTHSAIIYDKNYIAKEMIIICIDSFNAINFQQMNKNEYYSFCKICLLLQTIIQYISEWPAQDYEFLQDVILKLTQLFNLFNSLGLNIYPVSLIQVFICFLHHIPQITVNVLIQNKILQQFLMSLVKTYFDNFIEQDYDRKMLCCAFTAVLNNISLCALNQNEVITLFNKFMDSFINQNQIELPKFSGEDEDNLECHEQPFDLNNLNNEYNMDIINSEIGKLDLPLKKFDEFKCFQLIHNKLMKDQVVKSYLFESYTQQDVNKLKEILQMKQLYVNNDKIVVRKIKKVKK